MTPETVGGCPGTKRKRLETSSSMAEETVAKTDPAIGATGAGKDANLVTQASGDSSSAIDDKDVSSDVECISYIEFYSGVGGWTMALEQALDKMGPLLNSTLRRQVGDSHKVSASAQESKHNSQHSNNLKNRRRCYQLKRLAALDHSDLCVRVFAHNFVRGPEKGQKSSPKPSKQHSKPSKHSKPSNESKSSSIERLPLRQLEDWSADVWVMSPPCQPHTRQHVVSNSQTDLGSQGLQQQPAQNSLPSNPQQPHNHSKDLEDPRSKSFLKLCEWLEGPIADGAPTASHRLSDEVLPSLIFLENVVGFEHSDSCARFRSALSSRGYAVGHFHLTPTQVGVPNDRPRHYTVAVRSPSAPESPLLPPAGSLGSYLAQEPREETGAPKICKAIPELGVHEENTNHTIAPIASYLDDNHGNNNNNVPSLRVPEKVLKNPSAWCFDIVCPTDRRSSCFTHSYGRFIRGTGSILYEAASIGNDVHNHHTPETIRLLPPDQREFSSDWIQTLDTSRLRYFSGTELARLFGFSENFSFPPGTSHKQQWKLLGNSLNVTVASKLVELGFRIHYGIEPTQSHE